MIAVGPSPPQKGAQRIQITRGLHRLDRAHAHQRKAHRRPQRKRRQPGIDKGADPAKDFQARGIQQALQAKRRQRQQRQPDERGNGPAGQHAIIDLQHIQRAGQHQDVHACREHGDMHPEATRGAQGLGDRIGRS